MGLQYNGTDVQGVNYNSNSVKYVIKDGKLVFADPNIYLESAGNPRYINTGFVPNVLCRYEFAYSAKSGSSQVLFGQRTSGTYGSSADQLYFDTGGTQQIFICGPTRIYSDFEADTKYVLSYTDTRTGYASTERPIYLFAFNMIGSLAGYISGKLYYFKIFNASTNAIIHHFVPVPSGMVIGNTTISANGMFDIVTQTPYYNSGLGDFTIGQDN